jgi:hypothetical protein
MPDEEKSSFTHSINLSVLLTNMSQVPQVNEVLSRIASGLVMDGYSATVSMFKLDEEEPDASG